MGLWHITAREDWIRAQNEGVYRATSLREQGFIHLSGDRQWLPVANALFSGRDDLVLLSLRADRLQGELRYEEADGDRFPHLYGELNLDAVVDVFDLPLNEDGTFTIPGQLLPWKPYFV